MPSLFRKVDWVRRAKTSVSRATHSREFWSLAALALILALLWDTPLVLPLKWLTVLFHELSHAMMGWATGGALVSLNITHLEGGICKIAGGNRTLILLAGYPGSLGWGLAALALSRRDRWTTPTLAVLGITLIGLTVIYVRPLAGFGFVFCILAGAILVILARKATPNVQRLLVRIVGLSSCMYVLLDIGYDVFLPHGGISDATLLARHTGIPAMFWGGFWYILSLAMLGWLLAPSRTR